MILYHSNPVYRIPRHMRVGLSGLSAPPPPVPIQASWRPCSPNLKQDNPPAEMATRVMTETVCNKTCC